MFRSEKELLSALLNAKKLATKTNKNEKYEIEDYRDENGFINLVDVDDFDEMKRIIELVDKKIPRTIQSKKIYVPLIFEYLLKFLYPINKIKLKQCFHQINQT